MDELFVVIQKAANTIATPNWADILSVCFSLTAVIVACIIAWRQNKISIKQTEIAGHQNRIALFEKRYELYQTVLNCIKISNYLICYAGEEDTIYGIFCVALNKKLDSNSNINKSEIGLEAFSIADKLRKAEFLFSPEISEYAMDLAGNLVMLFCLHTFPIENAGFEKRKENFCQAANRFEDEGILEKMKVDLQLQSITL